MPIFNYTNHIKESYPSEYKKLVKIEKKIDSSEGVYIYHKRFLFDIKRNFDINAKPIYKFGKLQVSLKIIDLKKSTLSSIINNEEYVCQSGVTWIKDLDQNFFWGNTLLDAISSALMKIQTIEGWEKIGTLIKKQEKREYKFLESLNKKPKLKSIK